MPRVRSAASDHIILSCPKRFDIARESGDAGTIFRRFINIVARPTIGYNQSSAAAFRITADPNIFKPGISEERS